MAVDLGAIKGSDKLISVYGAWPTFHDFEIVTVLLDRRGEDGPAMELVFHCWPVAGLDNQGIY
ncbi:MAG: hypothetical protein H0W86_05030 [Armatimonadetes bacterium]|nr:hypothetical protein [Armatimonadota bacterium]